MPSDPFESTLRAGQINQARADQAMKEFGQFGQQIAQGQQTQAMLKQFGILKDEEVPLTTKDIKDFAKKQGVGIRLDPNLPEEQQLSDAMKLAQSLGLPVPKPQKKTIFDAGRAAQLGTEYKPSPFGGEVAFKPPTKQPKSSIEQTFELDAANKKLIEQGMDKDYQATIGAGGDVQIKPKSKGFGQAQIAFGKEAAPSILDSLKNGDVTPYLQSTSQTKTAVGVLANQEGIKIDDMVLGYGGEKAAILNTRIQDQKVNAGISAQVLLNSSWDDKTQTWRVPPSMHSELALSVGRMLSQVGVIPYELMDDLRQKTAREQFAGMAIYLGADPKEVGGPTQDVIKLFAKTIQRETQASQAMRDRYLKGGVSRIEEFQQGGKSVTDVAGITKPQTSFKAGDIREKNGKKYQRNESGQWLPL